MSPITLTTEGDRHVVVTRRFAAPPELVYRAHIEPELIRKWLLGPDGWTMPVCISEARPGGKIRYEWSDGKGGGFYLTGEFVELVPFRRILHVERMHLPDVTPDNHVETRFEPDGEGTLMTMRMTLPDAQSQLLRRMLSGSALRGITIYDEPFWRSEGLSGMSVAPDLPVGLAGAMLKPQGWSDRVHALLATPVRYPKTARSGCDVDF